MAKKSKASKITITAFWDANIFCRYFNQEEHHEVISEAIEKAKSGELLIVTSALVMAECLKMKVNGKLIKIPAILRENIQGLFNEPYIEKVGITPVTARYSQDLVWEHNIDPKDALHFAAAIENKVPIFHSVDDAFSKRGIKHIQMNGIDMKIENPLESFPDTSAVQKSLFDIPETTGEDRPVQQYVDATPVISSTK